MTTIESGPQRSYRALGMNGHVEGGSTRRTHGNKRWVADGVTSRIGINPHPGNVIIDRWERGGHRSGTRGRGRGGRGKFGDTLHPNATPDGGATGSEGEHSEMEEEHDVEEVISNEPETPGEREKFWQELVKTREVERKRAIAEGKMDDPLKPKRLEDAITMVGTCVDMCPRFERYRRERENNLFEWETIPGTKRVDHKRAVKAYERAAGDKTLPSDLRPPNVLKGTLDYLFHELLPRGGFSETFNFIRDRSRSVRNDFTMQHEMGPVAMECHDRCARFHILALHIERDRSGFSIAMEEQQLMNTLQSLKEFYQDQRGHYQSPTELEMRVYHRLVHIRDQRERHDDIPGTLLRHPIFELTAKFRARIQVKSAPITKTSPLIVDAEAMHIFAELADVLHREGNVVMTYLVACILERHFGKDTIEDIESIRSGLSLSDIIDGDAGMRSPVQDADIDIPVAEEAEERPEELSYIPNEPPGLLQSSGAQLPTDTPGQPTQPAFFRPDTANSQSQPPKVPAQSAFSNLKTIPNAFGRASFGAQNVFKNGGHAASTSSVFEQHIPAPGMFPQREVTDSSGASVGSLTSVPSILPFAPPPAQTQITTFPSQVEQSSQNVAWSSPQPPPINESIFGASKKPIIGSETSTSKSLNPLAAIFIPTPNPAMTANTNESSITTGSALKTPSTNVHSSTESCQPDIPAVVSNEPSLSLSPKPTQEQSVSDSAVSEMPLLAKQAFFKWRQRLNDQVKWIEACQRSSRYKEKAQAERLSRSLDHTYRKAPSETRTRAPLKKRLRQRLSEEYRSPASDEELARRFGKNHTDHMRRWARGSFLGVLRESLRSKKNPFPNNWSVWLSLNQESDGTAIWLEQKFDVPDSGTWKNENVFCIPVSKDDVEPPDSYPGVVIFECTPLTGITDILSRKYRVLEDCARLREIIEDFPSGRHYIPSLLCITWAQRDPDSSKDFDDMVESMVKGGMLTSMNEFLISTAALDMEPKLEDLLHPVPFDFEGRLVKCLSLNDLFKSWEHQWEDMTTRGLSNCIIYGEFNWDLYATLLEGCTRLLVRIIHSVIGLLRDDNVPSDFHPLQLVQGLNSSMTFDIILDWLDTLPETEFTAFLMSDIRTHQSLGRDFPTMTFLSQLYALARSVAAHIANVHPEVTHYISRSRLDEAAKEVERLKTSLEVEMKACQIARLKPSKRLASFTEASFSRASTPRSKRQRLSDGSLTDEETVSPSLSSPPLSVATDAPSEPSIMVTPAMLRSLAKDVRAKYGAAQAQANPLSFSSSQ